MTTRFIKASPDRNNELTGENPRLGRVLRNLYTEGGFNIFSFKTILCRHLWNFILKSDNYILYMYITKLTCCETSLVPGPRWTSGLGYYWALLPIFSIQDLMAQRGNMVLKEKILNGSLLNNANNTQ
jgi:hypothetical protein